MYSIAFYFICLYLLFYNPDQDLTELKSVLVKYCIIYLQNSVQLAEKCDEQKTTDVSNITADSETYNSVQFLSNAYMTMAKYCRKFKIDDLGLFINIMKCQNQQILIFIFFDLLHRFK